MDLDISDILTSISQPMPPGFSIPNIDSSQTDHQLLVRAWINERCSPSLLPYPTTLLTRTMTRLKSQIARIEDLTAGVDNQQQDHSHGHSHRGNVNNVNLTLSILQTDLSRTQFLMRSLLRTRIAKVTRFAAFYLAGADRYSASLASDAASNSSPLLSPSELNFLNHHQALLSEFYDSSFLSSLPTNLRRLDDSAGGVSMVEGPDGGGGVVVRCLAESWGNEDEVRDGMGEMGEKGEEKASVELRLRRGEVWVVRWRDVKMGVLGGDVECL